MLGGRAAGGNGEMGTSKATPDLVVLGAMRAGTTTLYRLLACVPALSVAESKETDFFCSERHMSRGTDWYRRQFGDETRLWCDISPNYAKPDLHPETAALLNAAAPDAKLVFIARDPVDQAISHYRHSYFMGQDLPPPETLFEAWAGQHIINTASYAKCLAPFRQYWGGNIEIVDFDTFSKAPDTVVERLCALLGVDMPAEDLAAAVANSSDEMARLPGWWGRLRESEFGARLRGLLPRAVIDGTKQLAAVAPGRQDPPEFSPEVRQRLADALRSDAEAFRKETGLAFTGWQV